MMWRRFVSNHQSLRWFSSNNNSQPIIAICREESSIWERRAPLNPGHVSKLVKDGFTVLVQPSTRRAYSIAEYKLNGAVIEEDISEAQAIFGVKIIPPELIIPKKRYAFFSHTIKAQPENMNVLDALLEKETCFLDYEKMVGENGARLVAFGKMAGEAGMINILHGLGLRLLSLGYHTPFMLTLVIDKMVGCGLSNSMSQTPAKRTKHLGCAHNYPTVSAAKAAITSLGREIQYGLLPDNIGPMIFTFTGAGNVSQGAQEVFQELPHEFVSPQDLKEVSKKGDARTIYATVVGMEDHLEHVDGCKFDVTDFITNPEKYRSTFYKKILPYTTCLINGIYWAPGSPRLLTVKQCQQLQAKELDISFTGAPPLPQRLLAICDISADINGSIEFMSRYTSIDSPFALYDAHTGEFHSNTMSGPGIVISSIDNMPAQLPRESTDLFGAKLLPYINDFLKVDPSEPLESQNEVSDVIKHAIITHRGKLTKRFEYIEALRKKQE